MSESRIGILYIYKGGQKKRRVGSGDFEKSCKTGCSPVTLTKLLRLYLYSGANGVQNLDKQKENQKLAVLPCVRDP